MRRTASGGWEVLLVSALSDSALFILPKGTVERGERCKAAAARETVEEAGVAGALRTLGRFEYERRGRDYEQAVWLLYVKEEYGRDDERWTERDLRERRWLSFPAARALLADAKARGKLRPELGRILDAAEVALDADPFGVDAEDAY